MTRAKLAQAIRSFADGQFRLEASPRENPSRRPARHREKTVAERFDSWHDQRADGLFQGAYNIASTLICLGVIAILLVTVSYLPPFGEASNPVNNEVSQRYIDSGLEETGAINMVSGMILDYRAFDTFGESAVLFVATVSVWMLMKRPEEEQVDYPQMARDPIVKNVAKYIIPFLLIFGAYIILNGHISPGGGFAGGAVMGAGLILYSSAYGFGTVHQVLTQGRIKGITFCALLFYAIAKGYSFYTGAHHLETGIPLGQAGDIISAGLILPLNICVGLIVTCTMYSFYALFTKGDI